MKTAIVGYSGHAFVVLDAAFQANIRISYYCEQVKQVNNPFGLEYAGDENAYDFDWGLVDSFVLGVGNNLIRERTVNLIKKHDKDILTIEHPRAFVSKIAKVGLGTFIAPQATIHTFVQVGEHCILNTGCVVEHDCLVGDFAHIGPGAVLAGNVSVGVGTFVGANAVVKQGVTIGRNVVIGAGSVVLSNVPDHEVWFGNPAKRKM